MAIQSLKQLTVRIDKLGINQYHVRELIEKIDITGASLLLTITKQE